MSSIKSLCHTESFCVSQTTQKTHGLSTSNQCHASSQVINCGKVTQGQEANQKH